MTDLRPRAGGALLVRQLDSAVEVVFNRPERLNAFNTAVYEALLVLCAELHSDRDVRAVVFRGAGGRAFAAGNDISEFVGLESGAAGVVYEARIRRVLRAIEELPQVTVAAIDGYCVGGGLAVATFCDLRLCTEVSRFGYPIARTLGNALSAACVHRCVAVFGESLTREMLLASRLVGAHRAYSAGAVMDMVATRDALDESVEGTLAGLRAAAPLTLRTTKRQLLTRPLSVEDAADDETLLERAYGSAGFAEGVRAFLAKEQPRFDA